MPIVVTEMSVALRPFAPSRFKRGRGKRTVEELTSTIETLASERQELRARGASAGSLERNRVRLARAQWQLSHALIERHLPAA
jgi:hypothetical protein